MREQRELHRLVVLCLYVRSQRAAYMHRIYWIWNCKPFYDERPGLHGLTGEERVLKRLITDSRLILAC